MTSDPTTSDVVDGLSLPAVAASVSRRRFLQASAGAMTSAWALSHWTGRALAGPLSPSDGILVVILLPGGNDGLNTVIPTGTGAYYDKRGSLAIGPSTALPIGTGIGLHPALATVKARYDAGQVAIVRGVGNPGQDLSHFSNMATWMTGSPSGALPFGSGWLGRYLDGLSPSTLNGVALGSSVPLHMVGANSLASAVPYGTDGLFGLSNADWDVSLYGAIRALGVAPNGLGQNGERLAALGISCLDTAKSVAPVYAPPPVGSDLVEQMTVTARLINLNIGVRVFAVSSGDYDTHAGQPYRHATNLADLDAAIAAFYATLDLARSGQVLLTTFSEFGRRVEANGSDGTDHGTANTMLLLGPGVRAGIHGDQPSLTSLDADGDLVPSVDFRSVYATILDHWLGADAQQVLTKSYPELDLLAASPLGTS